MKRFAVVVWFLSTCVLALLIVGRYAGSESGQSHRGSVYPSEAVEGTEGNPYARIEYDWMRLRDPATNEIPRGIAHRELEFVHRMDQQAELRPVTSADDWIPRGPYNIGGRTKALAIDVTNENNILAGSTSSGMFKSIDGGSSWVKTTAPNQLQSVTCIAQNEAPGKENIWYYGTGDRSPYGMNSSADGLLNAHYRGDGIFKSTDSGETWTQLSSTVSGTENQTDAFDFVYGIVTFADDGVLAATASGVYTSNDGGASWSHPISLDNPETSPSTEVAKGPDGTLYATVAGNGPNHGVFRSADGEDWENISPGDWPDAAIRTVIAPAPSNADVVYFFLEMSDGHQQLRKYAAGAGWTDLTGGLPFDAQILTFGGVLMVLRVKPDDQDTIFLGTVDLFRSTDGGSSFELVSGHGPNFHVDQNSLAFYPSNPKRMIAGNDGGLYRTEDNLAATVEDNLDWSSLNNGYLTTQFYTVAIDHGTPGSEVLIGGTQDNGVEYTASSDPEAPWQILYGGDGGYVAVTDGGDYFYHSSAASLRMWRNQPPFGVAQRTDVTPVGGQLGLFLGPFLLDPHDQRIMYAGLRRTLWRNSDLTAIPHQDGINPTSVNWDSFDKVTEYVTALGMSPAEPRRLYYSGYYEGQSSKMLYIDNPQEGQPEPVDITGENFPYYPYSPAITCIAVDPRDADKVIVVFSSYGVISLFASEDGGTNWTPVAGNLEEHPDGTGSGPSVRWLSILYVQDQPVYLAATSAGLFSSIELDGMNTIWSPEARSSIGDVVVDMLDVRQSDGFVAAATHGNGVYTAYITTLPDVATAIEGFAEQPAGFEIASVYPNPFATSTTIAYELPRAGAVSAGVFDIRGRRVASLFEGMQQAGRRELRWNPSSVSDGVYFVKVDYDGKVVTRKVVLQR